MREREGQGLSIDTRNYDLAEKQWNMASQKETNEDMILDNEQGQKDSKISDRDITMEEEYTESNTGWGRLRFLKYIEISKREGMQRNPENKIMYKSPKSIMSIKPPCF